jgi:tetratricopeptide (TPR) repeat protein
MQTLAVLITPFFLAGLTWADCGAADSSEPEPLSPASPQLLRDAGYEHFRTGQYKEALVCYTAALQAAEAGNSQNVAAIASNLNDIGVLSEETGRYDDARKYYERELDVLRPLGEAGGTALGEAYMQLGWPVTDRRLS